MKKLFLITFMALCLCANVQAQFKVYDPILHKNNKKSLSHTLADLVKNTQHLQKLRTTLKVLIRSKEELEKKYQLQWQVREDLKKVFSVRNLDWADLRSFARLSGQVPTHLDAYLGPVPYQGQVGQLLQADGNRYGHVKELYAWVTGMDSGHPFRPGKEREKQRALMGFALEEAGDRQKIQLALSYQSLSEELLQKAESLQAALRKKSRFSMTEAERLQGLQQCKTYLLQSLELKTQADQMIRSVIKNRNPAKNKVISSLYYRLLGEGIRKVPQWKP
ncbi:hypothetical protein AAG747_28275 [Rapidithrix thailandica]|uniref:Uncharacterized protein n=1 Tax=Rapidithrix thailandica TaxID=413964 RepID=A0AAW9SLZ5_9BACT